MYPRVTSFDALKQSTDICAHQINFSSRKFIILNKLSCFQSKHTFWEVREHLFFLNIAVNVCKCADIIIWTDTSFDAFHWLLKKNIIFTVAQCSQGVLCILQERPEIISSS